MAWIRYDDQFYSNPKVTRVVAEDPGALALHVLANTWTNSQRHPGYVPAHQPAILLCDRVKAGEWAAVLVRAGLWHEHDKLCAECAEEYADLPPDAVGFVFHNAQEYRAPARYHTVPGTPADLSEKRREAGRLGGQAKAAKRASLAADATPDVANGASKPDNLLRDGATPEPVPEPTDRPTDGLFDAPPPATRAATRRPQATKPPAAPPMNLTYTQRSKVITDAYAAAQPLCKWPAVNGVVLKAIKTEQYADDEIRAAVLRLAEEGRSVTVDTLRVELSGLPPGRQGGRAAGYQPFRNDLTDADYEEYISRGR